MWRVLACGFPCGWAAGHSSQKVWGCHCALARSARLAYSGRLRHEELQMPIRTASLTNRISANGQALHRAMMSRTQTGRADKAPSEAEAALIEERRLLKDEREKRRAQALLPRPSALDRLVRTHHPQAKDKPKVAKEAHRADEAKKAKPHKTRADKQAEKAAALEAA